MRIDFAVVIHYFFQQRSLQVEISIAYNGFSAGLQKARTILLPLCHFLKLIPSFRCKKFHAIIPDRTFGTSESDPG
jgi:hypothetical protein